MILPSPLEQLDTFFQQYKPSRYKKRTLILQANDSPSSVFYIKSGYLRVYRISDQGEELTLTILRPKDFFPLTFGMTDLSNVYYLETMTPLELWKVPAKEFSDFVKKYPSLYVELTQRILVRFDSFITRMEYLLFSNAYTKVASTILSCALRLGQQRNNMILLDVPLTHRDIATFIGITRETTSLEMKKLEKRGFIKRDGKFMIIKNVELLKDEIEGETTKMNVIKDFI